MIHDDHDWDTPKPHPWETTRDSLAEISELLAFVDALDPDRVYTHGQLKSWCERGAGFSVEARKKCVD